jgi:hypothetical protein
MDRALILILGAVFAYCVFSTIKTLLQLRAVWNQPNQDKRTACNAIGALATRFVRLRQVIGATFYLFGLVLFLGMENITFYLADSKTPGAVYILDNFLLLCAFSANVFFIFLVLHCIQWAGSAVLHSFSRRAAARFCEPQIPDRPLA